MALTRHNTFEPVRLFRLLHGKFLRSMSSGKLLSELILMNSSEVSAKKQIADTQSYNGRINGDTTLQRLSGVSAVEILMCCS